jgi:hypothetical protein
MRFHRLDGADIFLIVFAVLAIGGGCVAGLSHEYQTYQLKRACIEHGIAPKDCK